MFLSPEGCGMSFSLTPWILGILAVAGWVTVVVFAFLWDREVHRVKPLPSFKPSRSWLAEFPNAAVASDNGVCSEIARNILRDGGNAADAAIAALICDGNENPFSMGLGGGFFMVLYNASTKTCTAVDSREIAPLWATPRAFTKPPRLGWKSIAVPGEVMGYWEVHKRFGSLPWKELWTPGIRLARDGIHVSEPMARIMRHPFVHKSLVAEPTMSFYMDSATGEVYKEGQQLPNPILAQTMDKLASSDDPVELFYKGAFAEHITGEIQKFGGNLTLEDLGSYKVRVYDGWQTDLSNLNLTFCSLGLPSGGPAAGLYLQILDALQIQPKDMTESLESATLAYHRFIEASKFAYGHWKHFADSNNTVLLHAVEKMKNPTYAKQISEKIGRHASERIRDYDARIGESGLTGPLDKGGTAQISIMDKWGNAVSVTSSINWLFGSMRRSPTTGIVWNNHLADFSTDGESENGMRPGKRPRSAMTPAIIFHKPTGVPRLVIGGAGGSKITGAVGYVAGRVLYLNETLKYASDAPRFFNRVENTDTTQAESTLPKEFWSKLAKYGHILAEMPMPSILQSVEKKNSKIFAHTDHRKPSYPAGY